MNTPSCDFKVGDTVEVIEGTIDPDFHFDIGGWTGKVTENDFDNSIWYCSVVWDGETIEKMGEKFTHKCDRMNLSYSEMCLEATAFRIVSNNGSSETEVEVSTTPSSKSLIHRILQYTRRLYR